MNSPWRVSMAAVLAAGAIGCASSGGMEWLDLNTVGNDMGPMFTVVGSVQHLDLEGGIWAIADTSGKRYVPQNLPGSFEAQGLQVEARVRRANRLASVGMVGDLIDIYRIRRRGSSQAADAGLAGTSWKLNAAEVTDAAAETPTLNFHSDSMVAGTAGCNRYFGKITITGDSLEFGELASTRRMCEPATMKLEEKFLKALNGKLGYELNGDRLVIKPTDGATPLRFDAVSSEGRD